MTDLEIIELLQKVKNNEIDEKIALDYLKKDYYEDLTFAKIDHSRKFRNGAPEVIYCEGKTVGQISKIIEAMTNSNSNVFGTRLDKDKYDILIKQYPNIKYNEIARTMTIINHTYKMYEGSVAIVCAGTSDLFVAEEVYETLCILGVKSQKFYDVGVAGIHRLFDVLPEIKRCSCIVAVAGMEGALSSVIGGLVNVPIVSVPTSIGYGTNFGGVSALLTMLNSCSNGVSVVNIDNGFGAAYFAYTIINAIEKEED